MSRARIPGARSFWSHYHRAPGPGAVPGRFAVFFKRILNSWLAFRPLLTIEMGPRGVAASEIFHFEFH